MALYRKLFAILLLLAVLKLLVGCEVYQYHQNTADQIQGGGVSQMEYVLTERQIALLRKLGLPTDYNELNAEQKNAIQSIDRMLSYLEEKYGIAFSYLGYVPGGIEREHLIALPSEGDRNAAVTVYCDYADGQYTYEDNYHEILATPLYLETVRAFVFQHMDADHTKVFCEMKAVEQPLGENILKSASATIYIFISHEGCTPDEFDTFANTCGEWLKENFHGKPSRVNLFLTESDAMLCVAADTYRDVLADDIFLAQLACSINGDGSLYIR